MTTETADWVGLTLDGRYTVAAKLGEGGMGFVYRAADARLGCDVVVKVPRASMLDDAGFRERFRAEVGTLVRLAHPHVVKVSDFGQHAGVPFAVMQFLPGGSLEDRRPKDAAGHFRAISPKSLGGWLPAVADALDFIHKQGYVHRDIKPANILFDAHKNAYISDFGVAKAVAGTKAPAAGITGAGLILGTPTYMAPELVLGKSFDGRIDQYALAVTVFELLAGRPPFDGPTPMAVLIQRTTEEPPALSERQPGMPAALSAAIIRAMCKDPAGRYPTCTAFAKAVLEASRERKRPEDRESSIPPVVYAPGSPKPSPETPRAGVTREASAYNLVGPKVRPHWERPAAAKPAAAPPRASSAPKPVEKAGGNTTLVTALACSGVLFAGLLGLIIWMATRSGTASRERERPERDSVETVSARPVRPLVPDTPAAGAEAPGSARVTGLHVDPSTVELLANGGWVPVDVHVERRTFDPVTLDAEASGGIEVKPTSAVTASAEPVRFQVRAVGNSPTAESTVRVGVPDTDIRRTMSVTIKRLDFEVSLVSPEDVPLSPGQEKQIELRIDRSGGYPGALTITVPASDVVTATPVKVSAGAQSKPITLVARPGAKPGPSTVRLHVVADTGGASHDLPVTVRFAPVVEVRAFDGQTGTVNCASLSANGRLALTGGSDGTVRLWDTTTGREKWNAAAHQEDAGGTRSVAFSAAAESAISGGADGKVRLYDVVTGRRTDCNIPHKGPVWLVHFDSSTHARSVSHDQTVHWVVAAGKPRQVPSPKRSATLPVTKDDITAGAEPSLTVHFPNDSGEFLLSGLGGRTVTVFKRAAAATPEPRTPVRTGSKNRAAGRPAAPRPSSPTEPEPQHIAQTPPLSSPAKLMAISADGTRLLTIGADNAVWVWEVSGPGDSTRPLPGFPWTPDYAVTAAALDGDGRQLLLGGAGGVLKLWRLP